MSIQNIPKLISNILIHTLTILNFVTILITLFYLSYISNSHEYHMYRTTGILSPDTTTISVTPTRIYCTVLLPSLIAYRGYTRGSLCLSGALFGIIVATVFILTNYGYLYILLFFFLSSSKATSYGWKVKCAIEGLEEQSLAKKSSGNRNWMQVVCNSGIATQLSLLYLMEYGIGLELPINFEAYFRPSIISLGVLGAVACSCGDTWASELGSVWRSAAAATRLQDCKTWPVMITSGERVPVGTNGAVSLPGLIFSFLGGLGVGLAFFVGLFMSSCFSLFELNTFNQLCFLACVGGVSGLFGSMVDSFLGATLQFSGRKESTGGIVEVPGPDVKPINDKCPLLDNHGVNLLSSAITAVFAPIFGLCVAQYFGIT